MSSPTAAPSAALVERLRAAGVTVSHVVGHLTYGDAVSFDAVNKWQALRRLVSGFGVCPASGWHAWWRPSCLDSTGYCSSCLSLR